MKDLTEKTIIITGATSGIGQALARKIAQMGATPILIGRSLEKLEQEKMLLEHRFNSKTFIYQADLLNNEQYTNVLQEILGNHPTIDGLINNAGFGVFQEALSLSDTDLDDMFQVNVLALIKGTKQLLNLLEDRAQDHKIHPLQIINVASFAGKIATPKSSAYAATKHAVLGYTNALRLEMKQKNVKVMAVNLGPVRTNFFERADPSGDYQKNLGKHMLDPKKVAKKITRHLFTNKREINLPTWMNVGNKCYQLFPGLTETLMSRQFQKK